MPNNKSNVLHIIYICLSCLQENLYTNLLNQIIDRYWSEVKKTREEKSYFFYNKKKKIITNWW